MSLHLEAVVQTYAYEAAWITYNKLNFSFQRQTNLECKWQILNFRQTNDCLSELLSILVLRVLHTCKGDKFERPR